MAETPIDDEFADLDLADLDLDHIELETAKPTRHIGRWVTLGLIVLATGFLLWFPNTTFYRLRGSQSWPFFVLTSMATLLGVFGGRFLWMWAQEAAQRWQRAVRPQRAPAPPSKAARWVMGLLAVAGAAVLLFGVSRQQLLGGSRGFSGAWFAASAAALVVGILAGRWLLAQEHNPFKPRPRTAPVRFPPWFKWVTLAILLGVAGLALFGMKLFPGGASESLRFTFGGVAFVVGVFAAIWLARRFDELEQRSKATRLPATRAVAAPKREG